MYIIVNIVSESPHTSIFFVGMEKLKKQGLCQVEYQKVEEGKYRHLDFYIDVVLFDPDRSEVIDNKRVTK